jgi:hypothetical protein
MANKIVRRILKASGNRDILEILCSRLSNSDLQSLLLEVYKIKASGLKPAAVLQQYEKSRFVRPAQVAPLRMQQLDALAFSLLPRGYEIMELSPVAPLGSCSVLGSVDQYNIVATIRNNEVCSDSTNVLALETALRRRQFIKSRKNIGEVVRLCTSHRVLRGQMFSGSASFAHFRLLGLVTGGRDTGSFGFEIMALNEQIEYFISLISGSIKHGFSPGTIRVALTAFDPVRIPALESDVIAPLSLGFSGVHFHLDQERKTGKGYYGCAGYQIHVSDSKGEEFLIVDGGFTDWTQKLLGSQKERLLIGGMGSERFIFCFDKRASKSV